MWTNLLEKEHYAVRLDQQNNHVIFEVNSGGFSPKYVTLTLDSSDVEELASIFQDLRKRLNK